MPDKHEMSKADASRIQSSQAKSGGDMSSRGFAAHAQAAGDKNVKCPPTPRLPFRELCFEPNPKYDPACTQFFPDIYGGGNASTTQSIGQAGSGQSAGQQKK